MTWELVTGDVVMSPEVTGLVVKEDVVTGDVVTAPLVIGDVVTSPDVTALVVKREVVRGEVVTSEKIREHQRKRKHVLMFSSDKT